MRLLLETATSFHLPVLASAETAGAGSDTENPVPICAQRTRSSIRDPAVGVWQRPFGGRGD
ncbi:uncharacterized protein ColSpa_10333 [Colletotrichum spaethianum]|uniref:Uncharacterized protein n=1 Tax=Colletotrichum spaethianum TaxID=700344 RepID=A0AA37PDD5_9PEZI|nr:uncharacterized protein ColSpa_10333 [Colletotrichum spaethianum]GKT50152.1 hypothetical protein ColSpa_10333 [Colletotrichum spaethianum]